MHEGKKMSVKSKMYGYGYLAALLLIVGQLAIAQETEAVDEAEPADEAVTSEEAEASAGPSRMATPGSVAGQQAEDASITQSLTGITFGERYSDWKEGLQEDHGLSITFDYNSTILTATDTLNDDDVFAGGVIRFFGQWDATGKDSGNTGSLIWKVENRHRYTDLPPSAAKGEIGYIGLISPTFSNIQTRLTNLYWRQFLKGGRVEIAAGFIDTTDWIDVYILAPPWTSFSNFSMATGSATIAPPDEAAIGAYFNAMLGDKVYIMAGFADSNADSTDPFNGFDTFFNDHEFIKTVEIGFVPSQDHFYLDNTHVTLWHTDERKEAGVDSGWGASFSWAKAYKDNKIMPFVRGGYAKEGGTFLQKSISAGFAFHYGGSDSLFGLGVNWGQPNEDTFGPGLDDQTGFEVFTRLQIAKQFQLSPAINYVRNPALNTESDDSWVFGLRARLYF